MRRIIRAVDVLTLTLAVIAGVAVVALMLHVTLDVVMRGLFNKPPTGTIVFVSNYYMVLVVCLPLALAEFNMLRRKPSCQESHGWPVCSKHLARR